MSSVRLDLLPGSIDPPFAGNEFCWPAPAGIELSDSVEPYETYAIDRHFPFMAAAFQAEILGDPLPALPAPLDCLLP